MSKGMGNLYLWPLAIGLALVSAVAAAAAFAPGQVLRTPWQPVELEGFNNCNGESVEVSGQHLWPYTNICDTRGKVAL